MDGIFGIDWNQDGQVDIVEDMITADVLGLFDEEEKTKMMGRMIRLWDPDILENVLSVVLNFKIKMERVFCSHRYIMKWFRKLRTASLGRRFKHSLLNMKMEQQMRNMLRFVMKTAGIFPKERI